MLLKLLSVGVVYQMVQNSIANRECGAEEVACLSMGLVLVRMNGIMNVINAKNCDISEGGVGAW